MFKLLETYLEENNSSIIKSQYSLKSYLNEVQHFPYGAEHILKQLELFEKEVTVYRSLCTIRAQLLVISKETITWRDVLDFKRTLGFFGDGLREAKNLSYPFFLWNGLIYSSKLEDMIAIGTVEDLS